EWILKPLSEQDRAAFTEFERRPGKHGRTLHKSLDCSIMDVADDIAYGVHDLEDAVALRLVTPERFRERVTPHACGVFIESLSKKYTDEPISYDAMVNGLFGDGGTRKRYISRLVNYFLMGTRYMEMEQFKEPLLRYRLVLDEAAGAFLGVLKRFIMEEVIRSASVQQLEFKGQGMVVSVFEAFQSDPVRLLPAEVRQRFESAGNELRVVCDFVAGMTDAHLLKTYERLFTPRMASIFDRL